MVNFGVEVLVDQEFLSEFFSCLLDGIFYLNCKLFNVISVGMVLRMIDNLIAEEFIIHIINHSFAGIDFQIKRVLFICALP